MITLEMFRAQMRDFAEMVGSKEMEEFLKIGMKADPDNSIGKLAFILAASSGEYGLEKYILGYMWAGYKLAKAETAIKSLEKSLG